MGARPSNVVLRVERGPENGKIIFEATDVSLEPRDDSLFEPSSDYRRFAFSELMIPEITPPIIADTLFGEAESVSI